MEILRAIERADKLCPNPYTLEEKLRWCDEVTAEIRRNVVKIYDTIETTIDRAGRVELPDDIPFERVELAFVGGCRLDKYDFRSLTAHFSGFNSKPGETRKISVVFLTLPEPIRTTCIKGCFDTNENLVEISDPPFMVGDKVEIAPLDADSDEPDWDAAASAYVMEKNSENIILDSDVLTPQTGARLAIRRVITDVTEIDEMPYDGMYIEYILAKIALYQHDYTGYGAHMTQYNSLFDALRKEYKSRGPLTTQSNFRNY